MVYTIGINSEMRYKIFVVLTKIHDYKYLYVLYCTYMYSSVTLLGMVDADGHNNNNTCPTPLDGAVCRVVWGEIIFWG